jgi:DNA-binding MarR family transcriptional regulator
VRRTPDRADGRYTLAILTDEGWAKIAATAPGHVEEVHRLVFDPPAKAQSRQLPEIGAERWLIPPPITVDRLFAMSNQSW